MTTRKKIGLVIWMLAWAMIWLIGWTMHIATFQAWYEVPLLVSEALALVILYVIGGVHFWFK